MQQRWVWMIFLACAVLGIVFGIQALQTGEFFGTRLSGEGTTGRIIGGVFTAACAAFAGICAALLRRKP